MSKFNYLVTSNYISVMNLETGSTTTIRKEDATFEKALALCKEKNFEAVERLNAAVAVQEMLAKAPVTEAVDKTTVTLERGALYFQRPGAEKRPLNNAITDRVVTMAQQGFDIDPMLRFMENLLSNPSKTAIDELYLFIEACELPITEDGCFVAYKIVKNDYTSIHDGKFMNAVGSTVSMERSEVDDRRENTCSQGLHFCSRSYLSSYGSNRRSEDRLLLLKINPADVVSIPSDYNNAKGRAWRYEILKDITTDEWRATFKERDYTDSAVVDEDGDEWDEDDWDEDDWDAYEEFAEDLMTGGNPMPSLSINKSVVDKHRCPDCGSVSYQKKGYNYDGSKARRKCNACGKNWYV